MPGFTTHCSPSPGLSMIQANSSLPRRRLASNVIACLAAPALLGIAARPLPAQTVFLDFNTPGQYTANFNPWDNAGAGNYNFQESGGGGVGGSGCVSVFQSNDTTAAYKSGSWDFSINGASMTLSTMVKA